MLEPSLFLGIAMDGAFKQALKQTNPHVVSFFMKGGDYLSEIEIENRHYIGKPLPLSPTIQELNDHKNHLISLLQKLTPDYCLTKNPPKLLTKIHDSSCH